MGDPIGQITKGARAAGREKLMKFCGSVLGRPFCVSLGPAPAAPLTVPLLGRFLMCQPGWAPHCWDRPSLLGLPSPESLFKVLREVPVKWELLIQGIRSPAFFRCPHLPGAAVPQLWEDEP